MIFRTVIAVGSYPYSQRPKNGIFGLFSVRIARSNKYLAQIPQSGLLFIRTIVWGDQLSWAATQKLSPLCLCFGFAVRTQPNHFLRGRKSYPTKRRRSEEFCLTLPPQPSAPERLIAGRPQTEAMLER
jgi:hypothetical protein